MKTVTGRIISGIGVFGVSLFAGVRLVLDLVGYSTLPDDYRVALGRLGSFFDWLLSVPSWLVLGLALASLFWLIWVSWPRTHHPQPAPGGPTPEEVELFKQQRLLDKQQRNTKPLTPHAVEQKLRVIDKAIELMADAPSFSERLSDLFNDDWQKMGKGAELHEFSDRVGSLHKDVTAFSEPIERLRMDYKAIYPDISEALEQTYLADALNRLAEYQNACREVEVMTSKGAHIQDVNFMYSQFISRTQRAVKSITVWRETVRNQLAAIRNAISDA